MFVRIVKLSLEPSKIQVFLANFDAHKEQIRMFKGCLFLELYRDKDTPNIFFTYSYWNTPIDLENYRNSDLFRGIWSKTKPMFNGKPEAWSVDKLASLK